MDDRNTVRRNATRIPVLGVGLALVVSAWAPVTGRAEPRIYQVTEDSTIGFEASAGLHRFEGDAKEFTGEATWDSEDPLAGKGRIVIDATRIRTGNKGRDKDMRQKALHTDRFPEIVMEMSRFVPHAPGDAGAVAGAASSGGGPRWTGSGEGNLHGSLTLHGTTRKLVVPSVLETRPDGSLRITGKVGLDMTDFGVKPPSMLFFRVRPGVTVSFDLGWKPAAPGAGGLSGTASARTARVPDADDQE